MTASASAPLFTADDLARLDRLRLPRRRTVRGEGHGEWRSHRFGTSGLFAEHRGYVGGDDLRYVDWNVYGRLGALVVKRFEAEENVNLLLLVDRSLSMAGPKSFAARRLAGALGTLALSHDDHVRLGWLPARDAARDAYAAYRGRGRVTGLLDELASTREKGDTDHVRDLARVAGRLKNRGLAVLLSDFYDPAGAIRGLALLRAHGQEVGALHVLDPEDVRLPPGAPVLARDRETGATLALDVTPTLEARVREVWRRRADALERWCLTHEIRYLRVDARRPLWDVLRDLLRPGPGASP